MSSSMMYTPLRDDSNHRSLSNNERKFILDCATGRSTITSDTNTNNSSSNTDDATTTTTTTAARQRRSIPNPHTLRTDGRTIGDSRPVQLLFGRSHNIAECDVRFGCQTRASAVVTCRLVPPLHPKERPNEGQVTFAVDLSPMASSGFEYIGPSSTQPGYGGGGGADAGGGDEQQKLLANRILRILERTLIAGGAMDAESLCVQSGKWVWRLHVQVTVLDHGGNLVDASVLAAVAALRHFRVPQVALDGSGSGSGEGTTTEDQQQERKGGDEEIPIVVHSDEREPTPLPIHHTPLASTFALYRRSEDSSSSSVETTNNTNNTPSASSSTISAEDAVSTLIDPTHREELVADGTITFAFNKYGEMCCLDFPGGCELGPRRLGRCAIVAKNRCVELCGTLERALGEADGKASKDRLERLRIVKEREEGGGGGELVGNNGGGGVKRTMDNRHLLPETSSASGLPFTKQTQCGTTDGDNDVEMLQVPNEDLEDLGSQKAAAVVVAANEAAAIGPATTTKDEEEERYRLQALDYTIGHVAARVKDGPVLRGGTVGGGGSGGKTAMGSGSLLAAMLRSANGAGSATTAAAGTRTEVGSVRFKKEEEVVVVEPTNTTNKQTVDDTKGDVADTTTAVSSNRTPEADEEFARYAAEAARSSSSSSRTVITTKSGGSRTKKSPTHTSGVLDSDEEEATTTLKSEFSVNETMDAVDQVEDIHMEDVANDPAPVKKVVNEKKEDKGDDDDDDIDLSMAVKKKKKSKKSKKKK